MTMVLSLFRTTKKTRMATGRPLENLNTIPQWEISLLTGTLRVRCLRVRKSALLMMVMLSCGTTKSAKTARCLKTENLSMLRKAQVLPTRMMPQVRLKWHVRHPNRLVQRQLLRITRTPRTFLTETELIFPKIRTSINQKSCMRQARNSTPLQHLILNLGTLQVCRLLKRPVTVQKTALIHRHLLMAAEPAQPPSLIWTAKRFLVQPQAQRIPRKTEVLSFRK